MFEQIRAKALSTYLWWLSLKCQTLISQLFRWVRKEEVVASCDSETKTISLGHPQCTLSGQWWGRWRGFFYGRSCPLTNHAGYRYCPMPIFSVMCDVTTLIIIMIMVGLIKVHHSWTRTQGWKAKQFHILSIIHADNRLGRNHLNHYYGC